MHQFPGPLRSYLRTILSFSVAGVFLYAAFRGTNVADLWDSLTRVNYFWVALLVPVVLLSHWVRAVRWSYLLPPVKHRFSVRNLFSAVMIGYAVNNVLPRVGEIVRPMVAARLEGISRSAALGSVVIERIIDFVSFYLLAFLVLALYPTALNPFVDNPETFRPLFLAASIVALAVFVLLFFKLEALVAWLSRSTRWAPERYRESMDRIARSFGSGVGAVRQRNTHGVIILYSLMIWGLYVVGMYIPFSAFEGMAGKGLDLSAAVVLLVITSVAWILPAPGAMGTYHSFITIALVRLYAVDDTTALSFSIVTHELGFLLTMLAGAYFWLKDHRKVGSVSLTRPEDEERPGAEATPPQGLNS